MSEFYTGYYLCGCLVKSTDYTTIPEKCIRHKQVLTEITYGERKSNGTS